MRIIIMGCGRVGARLAEMFANENHKVAVIDSSPQAFSRLPKDFSGAKFVGDGLDEDVLKRAGIQEADCFVAVTNGDNRNIMAAQIAKHNFHVQRVLCRIYDPIRQQVYSTLGLESICPTTIGAKLIHDAVLEPERTTISAALSIAEGYSVPLTPVTQDERVAGDSAQLAPETPSNGTYPARPETQPASEASRQKGRR
jgi:trk system potassium uptake protein TrkA